MKILGKISVLILMVTVILAIWLGSENKVDPDWEKIHRLTEPELFTLKLASDSLQAMLENFYYKKFKDDSLAFKLISDPFTPTMEYNKFKYFFELLTKNRFNVISSVTGTGSSTLIDRVAKAITLSESRILNIPCAPQFDLIYHQKYIGDDFGDKFEKGDLLKFWDKCLAEPKNNFVVIIDNFDKINPETFFGPDLWEKLSDQQGKVIIGGSEIIIPSNFYMISTIVAGLGNRVQFNNEHFKKLGNQYFLNPSTEELALYLYDRKLKLQEMINPRNKFVLTLEHVKQHRALQDKKNVHKFLYFFEKANDLIKEKYSRSLQLGQWNDLRKLYLPENFNSLMKTFIDHVNASMPQEYLTEASFAPIFYSLKHNGKIEGSNPISTGFKVFKEWGFFTEFVVAASFAIITALFSAYYVKKRKKLINKYLAESENIYQKYVQSYLHSGEALAELIKLKKEIDKDAKNGKINYAEAIFFYNSIRDRSQAIEITKNINESFLMLMDTFLEDDILSKNEYTKLNNFLDKIKFKIPKNDFIAIKEKIDKAWEEFGEK